MCITADHVSISQGVGMWSIIYQFGKRELFLLICSVCITLLVFGLIGSLFLPKTIMRGTTKEKLRW